MPANLQKIKMVNFFGIKDGKLLWNFGKYFGKPVETDLSYCKWVMTTDIPVQSKNVLKNYLRRFDCER